MQQCLRQHDRSAAQTANGTPRPCERVPEAGDAAAAQTTGCVVAASRLRENVVRPRQAQRSRWRDKAGGEGRRCAEFVGKHRRVRMARRPDFSASAMRCRRSERRLWRAGASRAPFVAHGGLRPARVWRPRCREWCAAARAGLMTALSLRPRGPCGGASSKVKTPACASFLSLAVLAPPRIGFAPLRNRRRPLSLCPPHGRACPVPREDGGQSGSQLRA